MGARQCIVGSVASTVRRAPGSVALPFSHERRSFVAGGHPRRGKGASRPTTAHLAHFTLRQAVSPNSESVIFSRCRMVTRRASRGAAVGRRILAVKQGPLGTLGGTRTPNLLVRSQTLYPLSYEGKMGMTPHGGKYSSLDRML